MSDTSCRRLTDDVCVVTGAGRDVGRGIAHRLAAEGARVVLVDGDEERGWAVEEALDEADYPGEAKFVRADLTDEAAVKGVMHAVADEWGDIDGLVNAAAEAADESVLETSEREWDRALAVTLKSAFFCTKHAAPIMARDGGAIVNVASTSAHGTTAEAVAYCTAEGGLRNFTRQTATDLAAYDVRVNTLSPIRASGVEDDEDRSGEGDEEGVLGRDTAGERDIRTPRPGRTSDADACAAAAAYLLSDDAEEVTGIELPVDGGASASL